MTETKAIPVSINYLNEISKFIFTNKYARYREDLGRRETWDECVDRVQKMHIDKFKKKLTQKDIDKIKWSFDLVKQKRVVPSMRSMQFGGQAVHAHNARLFNCAVRHVDSIRSFSEIFYLLLCGCGVGIGLQKKFIDRLPDIVNASDKTGTVITYTVQDNIEGWADSIEALLNCYFRSTAYTGRKIIFDYSRIRPEGTPLKTGGGKAPGYKGLKKCHQKVKALFDYIIEEQQQTRIKTVNAYDILMHCADAVLSGGIRRSATSVIFDKEDKDLLESKTFFNVDSYKRMSYDEDHKKYYGKVVVNKKLYDVELKEPEYKQLKEKKTISWLKIEPQRARSNNSVLLNRKTTTLEEFKKIIEHTQHFGEPGFVWSDSINSLFNPCFEIQFEPVTSDGLCGVQFCNLTSANGAKIKSKEDYFEAIEAATVIGTLQATYTDFKYLSHIAKQLTEDESLLGVSITGIMDNPDIILSIKNQRDASKIAVDVNREWAKKLGIKQAARITCVKPEGTSSLVLESASGIHPHHARRYIRRVQCNKIDPVYKFFKQHNPHMCEPSVWSANNTDDVISFIIQVPDTAMIKEDLPAIKHLDLIKSTQQHWVIPGTTEACTKPVSHNVSCTVIVKDNEWNPVEKYIYENRHYFSAVALVPHVGDKLFNQAPNEAIATKEDEEKWNTIISKFVPVDYTKLKEKEDNTTLTKEVACGGGACELIMP